jgi:hypothetical protein
MNLRPAALALLIMLGSPATGLAQIYKGDPRYVEDPRETKDPRETTDPRENDLVPDLGSVTHPPEGEDLFEQLYASGNHDALSQAMRQVPWQLLDYVQKQNDLWLTHIDGEAALTPTGRAQGEAIRTKGLAIARLADSGLGDSRFEHFTRTLQSWTKEQRALRSNEQAMLKLGSETYDQALDPEQTLAALTPLRQALANSRQLGDLPAEAECLMLIGWIQTENLRANAARESMREAVRVGREVRHFTAVWDGLAVIVQASLHEQDFDSAHQALVDRHQIALERADDTGARAALMKLQFLNAITGEAGGLGKLELTR